MTLSKSPRPQPVQWSREPSKNCWRRKPPCLGPSSLARPVNGFARWNAPLEQFSSGEARSNTSNPSVTARPAAGIFFPQRQGLRLTPHSYSPSVLGKLLRASARDPSFQEAADALKDLAEVTISSRQLSRIAQEVGQELQADRDHQVEQFKARELEPTVATRPALAVVEVDGGRLQIRGEGEGPGAHDSSWREDKVSVLATAAIKASDSDPEPDLPECFRNQEYVEKLVRGIAGVGPIKESDAQPESPSESQPTASDQQDGSRTRPKLLVRTYVASTCPSEEFGPMVAAEAQRRNFMNAGHRAFVGDGAAWIWKLQKQYFHTFQPIVDFLHVLAHLFAAAKAAATGAQECWALFQTWAEACWQGRVGEVIEQMRARGDSLGPLPEGEAERLADDDPRKILAQELGYLERNQQRMDYPRYRQQGLPFTSSHMESTVKLFNRRVKGTEKFWGEPGAEAILQLRAAFLTEDDRLGRHLKTRPCSAFRTYKTREHRKAA
jgi:hypothetical protein